jgi:hypothetical protein
VIFRGVKKKRKRGKGGGLGRWGSQIRKERVRFSGGRNSNQDQRMNIGRVRGIYVFFLFFFSMGLGKKN